MPTSTREIIFSMIFQDRSWNQIFKSKWKENDVKTLGEMFLLFYDDIADSTFIEAMRELISMISELSKEVEKDV